MSVAVKSQPQDMSEKKLKEFQKRLKQGLQELESQYAELMASMQKNKEAKAELASEGQALKKRMERMAGLLKEFNPYAKKQANFLKKLQKFQAANEELMRLIANRLEEIEHQPELQTEPDRLKGDLLGMLAELSDMRRRREALLRSIKKHKQSHS